MSVNAAGARPRRPPEILAIPHISENDRVSENGRGNFLKQLAPPGNLKGKVKDG
jgi:hypothetical protein